MFFGGSQDGAVTEGETAPDVLLVNVYASLNEVYARKSEDPPFIYIQVGYAENESLT